MNIPYIDVQKQTELTEAQVKFFHDNGFLVLRNSLSQEVRFLSIFSNCLYTITMHAPVLK